MADRFIALYWRQVTPFGEAEMLAQNTGRQASAITTAPFFVAYSA